MQIKQTVRHVCGCFVFQIFRYYQIRKTYRDCLQWWCNRNPAYSSQSCLAKRVIVVWNPDLSMQFTNSFINFPVSKDYTPPKNKLDGCGKLIVRCLLSVLLIDIPFFFWKFPMKSWNNNKIYTRHAGTVFGITFLLFPQLEQSKLLAAWCYIY